MSAHQALLQQLRELLPSTTPAERAALLEDVARAVYDHVKFHAPPSDGLVIDEYGTRDGPEREVLGKVVDLAGFWRTDLATAQMNQQSAMVRLTIQRVDLQSLVAPGQVLLDITEPAARIVEHAVAWATLRGYDRLVPSLQKTLTSPGPDGWVAVINKPNSLAVLATWPWCEGPHDLVALYDPS